MTEYFTCPVIWNEEASRNKCMLTPDYDSGRRIDLFTELKHKNFVSELTALSLVVVSSAGVGLRSQGRPHGRPYKMAPVRLRSSSLVG